MEGLDNSHVEVESDARGSWSLVKVLDLTAVALLVAVVVRAIGGVLAAAGVPKVDFGAVSGSPVTLNLSAPLPTFLRLQYGTSWADLTTSLCVLGSVGLLALPRIMRDDTPAEEWVGAGPRLLMAGAVAAGLVVVTSVIGIINVMSNYPARDASTEAINVAGAAAAGVVAAVACLLSWRAILVITARDEQDRESKR